MQKVQPIGIVGFELLESAPFEPTTIFSPGLIDLQLSISLSPGEHEEAEFNRAKASWLGREQIPLQGAKELAATATIDELVGLGWGNYRKTPATVKALTREHVREVSARRQSSHRAVDELRGNNTWGFLYRALCGEALTSALRSHPENIERTLNTYTVRAHCDMKINLCGCDVLMAE